MCLVWFSQQTAITFLFRIRPLKTDFPLNNVYIYTYTHIYSVRISQETHYFSATESNGSMLFGETVAVYCENRIEHTDALCGQNAEILNVEERARTVTAVL
jgi:hypothetical protein